MFSSRAGPSPTRRPSLVADASPEVRFRHRRQPQRAGRERRPIVMAQTVTVPAVRAHKRADTITNAAALIRAGASAVKLEGGRKRVEMIRALVDAEIPVMGHIGLTPQSIHALGGFKVQGKELDAATALVDDALALVDAGCFSIVLECVPDEVARMVTEAVPVPTIGIGAGPWCDGQVLVFHDLLGLQDRIRPKFVRRYAELGASATEAVAAYAADVRARRFPADDESYHLAAEVADALG